MIKKFSDPTISDLAKELLGAMQATDKELAKLKAEAKQIKAKYKDNENNEKL